MSHVGGRRGDRFHSPAEQRDEINRWARDKNRVVEFFEPELDGKGDDPDRPVLRQVVQAVESGAFAGVVVAYQSRAGRDLELMVQLWRSVERAGGVVVEARTGRDGSTVDDRMIRTIMAGVDQAELERRREGFEHARERATRAGIWQRRQTPRGYDVDPVTRRLIPNEDAETVRRAFRDRAAGVPVRVLAERLGMTPSGARQLLRNRVYLGELKVGRHVNADAHPALVSVDDFDAAQIAVPRPPRSSEADAPALLAKLARCAGCGHCLPRSRSGSQVTYSCPTYHSGARCPAPASITAHLLDQHVEAIALAELARLRVSAAEGDAVEQARCALEGAERELRAFVTAVSAADIGADLFAEGSHQRRAAVDEARDALRAEQERRPVLPAALAGDEAWGLLDEQGRSQVLRGLLSAVVVRTAGRGRRVPVAERVRVLRSGQTAFELPGRGNGTGIGLHPLVIDSHDPDVLGVPHS